MPNQSKHVPENIISSLPCSLSSPHVNWPLPIFLCKYNSQLSAKKNLSIHLIFGFCSISRVYILDKTKATRLPAGLADSTLQKEVVLMTIP